jgi:hypothetical protein
MEHKHQWRATSKVFALVCECGVVYHDWLKVEIEKLKAASSSQEVAELRTGLEEARRELEFQAAEITDALTHAIAKPGS